MSSARKAHTKSRGGCQECKRKRVKCDENVPCDNCSRRSVTCSLASAESSQQPLASSTSRSRSTPRVERLPKSDGDFSSIDFTLYTHFMSTTSVCLSNAGTDESYPWNSHIAALATNHLFLLHEILAVGAIHLHQLHPGDPAGYELLAEEHQARALRLFRATLNSPGAERQAAAILTCSSLILTYSFAAFKDPASLLFNEDPPGPAEWMLPVRGIVGLIRQLESAGNMAPLLPNPVGPLEQPLGIYMDTWGSREPPYPKCESEDQLLHLQSKLESLTSLEDQAVHQPAITDIRKCFAVSELGTDHARKLGALGYPSNLSAEFLAALGQERRPSALVIMAFWCVLLSRIGERWWLRKDPVVQDLLAVIRSLLAPEFEELIQWPIQQVGLLSR